MKHPLDTVKVAIVYDHLTTQYGGAELVLQVLLALFPQAPLFTTVFDYSTVKWIQKDRVKTSFLQNFGWLKKQHQLLAPLHPIAIEQLDLSKYELIISVTAGVAKGVLTLPHQLHVCYQLTPPRYLSSQDDEQVKYLQSHGLLSISLLRSISKPLLAYMNSWDKVAAWRPDIVIAISQLVADRIKDRYGRTVDGVIYPPFIPFSLKKPERNKQIPEFLLSFSRLVSYKRVDLAIKSCVELQQLLVVAGEGIQKDSLQNIAPTHTYNRKPVQSVEAAILEATKQNKLIVFMGHCSEAEKQLLFSNCKTLIMAGIEDFGLTALEAAQVGVPSIINAKSGVAEILENKKYSYHLQEKTVTSLCQAIKSSRLSPISAKPLQALATKYNQEHFSEAFMNTLYQFWRQHSTISPVKLQK